MALQYMVEQKDQTLVTAKEISTHYDIPFDVVARSLQAIAKLGLLKSIPGSLGGYQLKSEWGLYSLLDLSECIDGHSQVVRCLDAELECDYQERCTLVDPVTKLNQQVRSFYQTLMLSQFITPLNSTSKNKKISRTASL